MAGYADSISTGVVMPVALTLLALFMILELYNATQRIAMNGSNNAFTIQQIALVMLKIVVCRWAVVHTTEILNALFEIASTVTTGISGYVGSGEVNTTVDIENAIAALPGGIGNMPVALELMVVGWMLRIVNIVVNTIVAARFIELYVYNAMASLSIATLCYQELHGIAVNFLKSYLAVACRAQCCIWSSAFIRTGRFVGHRRQHHGASVGNAGAVGDPAGGSVYERKVHESHYQCNDLIPFGD